MSYSKDNLPINKILNGDALTILKELPDDSINCVMTSPPYWALRDYGKDVESVWDGIQDCEHEWKIERTSRSNSSGGKTEWAKEKMSIKGVDNYSEFGKYNDRATYSNFCNNCGAWKGQLGLEPTFDLFIKHLCDIFDEVKRVLRKDGTCWVNLGDTYYGSGKGAGGDLENSKEVYQMPVGWNRPSRKAFNESVINKRCLICSKEIKTGINGQFCSRECLNKMGNNFRSQNRLLPDKTLTMIPFRFAIEMVNRGWILRNNIIWHKPNCMPSSVKDRFTVDFEYLFFFTKNKKYWFETQYEPHLWAEKDRRSKFPRDPKKGKILTNQYSINKVVYGKNGRNKRAVWSICPQPFPESHFAVYPEELCETPIKSGCPVDGIVLDPFSGAGTTGLVALKQNKKFIGIELNPEYIKIAEKRLKPYLEQTKLI